MPNRRLLPCGEHIRTHCRFVAGSTNSSWKAHGPRRCHHFRRKGTAEEKFEAFRAAGIACANDPSEIGQVLLKALQDAG